MPTIEERVAYLEGQVNELSRVWTEIRDAIRSLEQRIDVRFESIDRRFEAVDRRFETLVLRMEARFETVDRRIDALDTKVSRQFVWTVGIQITTLLAIVGALLARP